MGQFENFLPYSNLSKFAHRIEQIVLSAVSQHHFHRLFTSWAGVTAKDSAAITSATAAVPP
jgi:hypothetical protein